MGLIRIGILLIIVGFLLGLTGLFAFGGVLEWVGWVVLAIGVILALVHYTTGERASS